MVKLDDIPEEEARLELDKLQDFMDHMPDGLPLIALSEKVVEDTVVEGRPKVGGINITFSTPIPFKCGYNLEKDVAEKTEYDKGLKLTQKYSKISKKALKKAMIKLGLKSTEDLQKAYYNYRLRAFRVGFPRLIPMVKADIEVPTIAV